MNKKYIYKGMTVLAFVAAMASCEKDTLPTNFAPTVITGGTSDVYRTGVQTVNGTIDNPNGYTVEEYGIQYSLYQSFAEPIKIKGANMDSKGNFSVAIEGLDPGVGYYYRTYVFGGYNTIYGESRNFSTLSTSAPTFETGTAVSNVGLTSFDVEATLLDDGGADGGIQMRAFIYMPVASEEVTDLTMTTPDVQMMNVTEYKASITNLYTGTLYAVRPMAVTGSGIGYGTIAYVTTTATENALLSECMLSDTTSNSIAVSARVLAAGTHGIAEVGFCYTREEGITPTVDHPKVVAELEETDFKATLTGLNPATTYRIRAYVKDNEGTVVYSETKEYAVEAHQNLDIFTSNADEISNISARLWGNLRDNGVPYKERGFCWSTTEMEELTKDNAGSEVVAAGEEVYSYTLDVVFNTTYYFRAYAINKNDSVFYGDVMKFTTSNINTPVPMMEDATDITDSTAVVSATFSLNYYYKANYAVECGFLLCAGADKTPTLESHDAQLVCNMVLPEEHLSTETFTESFSGKFRELQFNTDYSYRAYFKNEKGLEYSEVKTFKTLKYTPNSGDAPFPDVNN